MMQRNDIDKENVTAEGNLAPLCNIVTPVGMLGYGFNYDEVDIEIEQLVKQKVPTAIILDSGSTDSGPSKLALGSMTCPIESYKRDLTKLLRLVNSHRVPLMFSSAGGDGSNDHVNEMFEIVKEIASSEFRSREFKVLTIFSEISKSIVKERLQQGVITGCGSPVPELTAFNIDSASRIVAQMGCEPFLDAMIGSQDFDVLIGGRAYDPSPYVAWAAYHALQNAQDSSPDSLGGAFLGGIFHMGKIMECGGLCAVPKSTSSVATIYTNGTFDIRPLAKHTKCTPLSVAAHTLYEKSRPDFLHGPGGCLDLTRSTYEQLEDDKTVRVRGAQFTALPTAQAKYTVKLEAARIHGYRTIFLGSFNDPILIGQLETLLDRVRSWVDVQHRGFEGQWKIYFHKHMNVDKDQAINGPVFIVGEVLADTQALATSVASTARIACVHGPYSGQKATSGNFAFGLGGLNQMETGPCAEFCIYHLMELDSGEERARRIGGEWHDGTGDENGHAQYSAPLFSWKSEIIGTTATTNRLLSTPESPNGLITQQINSTNGTSQLPKSSIKNPTLQTDSTAKYAAMNGHNPCKSYKTLGDVASVLRSKNAGPYEITFDVMFDLPAVYHAIKSSKILNEAVVSKLFGMAEHQVIYCGFFDQALAFKATIPRLREGVAVPSGGFMEYDVHGSQQYLPLMRLELPKSLSDAIQAIQE